MPEKTQFDIVDTILTEAEKVALGTFANNVLLFEAVKKVVLAGLYYNGSLKAGEAPNPTINAAYSLVYRNPAVPNETLGQDLRAMAEGAKMVELAFNKFDKFKPDEKGGTGTTPNPAR